MEEIKKLLKEVLNREFIRAVISSPKEKEGTAVLPVLSRIQGRCCSLSDL